MIYDKNARYRVVESATETFNIGDVIRQVKRTNRGILVGFNYRQSLYVDEGKNPGEFICWGDHGTKVLLRLEIAK